MFIVIIYTFIFNENIHFLIQRIFFEVLWNFGYTNIHFWKSNYEV